MSIITIKEYPTTLYGQCFFCAKKCASKETPVQIIEDEKLEIIKLCSRCRVTSYCSEECQKTDWPNHKSKCSVKTSTDEVFLRIQKEIKHDLKIVDLFSKLIDRCQQSAVIVININNSDNIQETFTERISKLKIKRPFVRNNIMYNDEIDNNRTLPINILFLPMKKLKNIFESSSYYDSKSKYIILNDNFDENNCQYVIKFNTVLMDDGYQYNFMGKFYYNMFTLTSLNS